MSEMNKEEKVQATENFKKSAELAKNLTEIADSSFVRFNDAKVRQAWKEVLTVVTKSGQVIKGMENYQAGPGDPMIEQMDELAEELEKLFNQVSINILNMKTLSEKNFSKRILSPTYLLTRYMKNCVSNPVAQAKEKLTKAYEAQVPLKLAYALLSILEIKATNPIGKSSDLEMSKWKDVIELILALLMFVEAFVNGLQGKNSVINLDLLIQATIKIFDQLRKFDNENSDDDAKKREEEERKRKEEEERRKKEEEERKKREEEEAKRKKEEEEKRKREEEEERKKKEEEEKKNREEEEERKRKEEEEEEARRKKEEEEKRRREEEERKRKEEEERKKREEEEERKKKEEEERKRREEEERKKKEEEERKKKEEEERKKKEEEERKKKEEEEQKKKEEEERKKKEEEERKKKEEEERKKREEEEARRKEEEAKKNAWINIKPWTEKFLEDNKWSSNSQRADKIREKVEQSIPGQAFYVAVFDQANKPADYSFYNPHGDNQLIWITAKGRCDCLIYRSLTGNQESAQNHTNLQSRMQSYEGFGKNITYNKSLDPTMENQIMAKESWKNNFVFMVLTSISPEIRWSGSPGSTVRINMKDVNILSLIGLINNKGAFLLSAFP